MQKDSLSKTRANNIVPFSTNPLPKYNVVNIKNKVEENRPRNDTNYRIPNTHKRYRNQPTYKPDLRRFKWFAEKTKTTATKEVDIRKVAKSMIEPATSTCALELVTESGFNNPFYDVGAPFNDVESGTKVDCSKLEKKLLETKHVKPTIIAAKERGKRETY